MCQKLTYKVLKTVEIIIVLKIGFLDIKILSFFRHFGTAPTAQVVGRCSLVSKVVLL